MIHLYDRATIEGALDRDLEPKLRVLLTERIVALNTEYGDLTDHSEFLIVEPGDIEADIVRHVGFSPLVDPIDGHRYPDPRFQPGWDYLADRCRWFELIFTFGSSYACIVLVKDGESRDGDLVAMCRRYARH